jgi:hypothetical protein
MKVRLLMQVTTRFVYPSSDEWLCWWVLDAHERSQRDTLTEEEKNAGVASPPRSVEILPVGAL